MGLEREREGEREELLSLVRKWENACMCECVCVRACERERERERCEERDCIAPSFKIQFDDISGWRKELLKIFGRFRKLNRNRNFPFPKNFLMRKIFPLRWLRLVSNQLSSLLARKLFAEIEKTTDDRKFRWRHDFSRAEQSKASPFSSNCLFLICK